jgi:hypothetical protein
VNALDLAAVKASLTRTLALPPAPAPAVAAALAAPSITDDLFGPAE